MLLNLFALGGDYSYHYALLPFSSSLLGFPGGAHAAAVCTLRPSNISLTFNENATNGLLCSTQCGLTALPNSTNNDSPPAPVCPGIRTTFTPCPPNSHTNGTGAASLWGCACDTGYYGLPACTICPRNAYCPPNASAPIPCPASLVPGADPALEFTTSDVGSTSFADCTCPYFATQSGPQCVRCPAGRFIFNNTCRPCPDGSFCPGNGLSTPCSRWAVCPAGSAGVGLRCANGSFFEPAVLSTYSTLWPVRGLANATAVLLPANLTRTLSPVILGGGEAGCADGIRPSFTNIVDAAYLQLPAPGAVWVSDQGCDAVRVVSNNGTRVTTVLGGIGGSLVLQSLPDGLLLVAGGSQLWAINPVTSVTRPLMPFSPPAISLAVLTLPGLSAYVVLVGTNSRNISFVSSANWTLVDSMRTPTRPLGLAYAGGVLYTDGLTIFQMSPGGGGISAWGDFFSLEIGPRNFLPQTFLPQGELPRYLDWNVQTPGALTVGQADRVSLVAVCTPCPANSTTSNDMPGLTRCQCAPGLYMLAGGGGCQPCPAGAFCPAGTVMPTLCPAGAWCGPGQSAPTPCDPSVFCGPGSLDEFGHGPGQSGAPACSAGYFRTAVACARCPNGSTTGGPGATSIADCACGSVVVNGRTLYTFLNVSLGGCSVCPATDYCPFGCYSPIPCPPGTYCGEGSLAPTVCPLGFYCPGGVPAPLSCEAGTFCPTGSGIRLACARGAYCPLEATDQLPCPAARYCPTGSGAPVPCPAGAYCGANASTPATCPGGSFCAENVDAPTTCPDHSTSAVAAGSVDACYCVQSYFYFTFADLTGMCVACPTGAFSLPGSRNFSDCTCETGFKTAPDRTTCAACAPSEYCPGGAARACPAGYVCTARSAGLCPPGFFCPGAQAGAQSPDPMPCEPGTYCPSGASGPLNCTAGYFCPGNNDDADNTTASNTSSPSALRASAPIICPPGFFCPPAASAPRPCPPGYQCALGSVLAAIRCTAGLFCAGQSATGAPCPGGAFCAPGASAPASCPAGQFCPPGAAAATLCPQGAYCPTAAANYTVCPPGYLCALAGMTAPVPCTQRGIYCPAGSFVPSACGPNMTTGNATLAVAEPDCLCVPGTRLVNPAQPIFGCAPCAPGGSYYQPLAVRTAACTLCEAGTSADGTSCPPADAPGTPIAAIIGGAAAAVVVVGSGAAFLTYGAAVFGGGKAAATAGAMALGGRTSPPVPHLFADVTLLLPSHDRLQRRAYAGGMQADGRAYYA